VRDSPLEFEVILTATFVLIGLLNPSAFSGTYLAEPTDHFGVSP
jgi:hypothetical protein